MRSRLMIHDGKSTIIEPAVVSRYYDDTLLDYVSQELVPAKTIVFDVPDGAKFGGYPVRKNVLVKPELQSAMYDKGFKFVRAEDEKAFLAEREAVETEKKRRDDEAAKAAEKEEEARARSAKSDQASADNAANAVPSGKIIFGDPAPVEVVETTTKDETPIQTIIAPPVVVIDPVITDDATNIDTTKPPKGGK
jgi:hypothetical protein